VGTTSREIEFGRASPTTVAVMTVAVIGTGTGTGVTVNAVEGTVGVGFADLID